MTASNPQLAQIAQLVDVTSSEGPGRRFAIWFQGCPFRCPGCCNPEMLTFEGGEAISTHTLCERIDRAAEQSQVEGVTLLGGEPFAHASAAVEITLHCRRRDLSVMVFSGYTLDEIQSLSDPAAKHLLSNIDVLVDGRYESSERTTARRWIGSMNQTLHFLTDRYSPQDPCWSDANTVEFHISAGGELVVSGFPAKTATAEVRRWERKRR